MRPNACATCSWVGCSRTTCCTTTSAACSNKLRAHLHEDPQRSRDGIAMCAGAGPIRRTRGVLLLPRRNPIVAASVRAVASDPAWAYPACLALLVHHARAPERLRRAWLRGGASS
ncbi:MAG: hypothetical protein U0168_00095 [Nannocystaceae bacterium]